jgi:transposase
VLQDAGATVHLAHPLGIKGFMHRRVKNDVRDAADLADLLRMGRLPEEGRRDAMTGAARLTGDFRSEKAVATHHEKIHSVPV